ncbi:MAG: hypothetical protein FJW40_07545 [Acidobacteria bacterium]|nr:hypothetical protein [Acidobacteriota bacterium]
MAHTLDLGRRVELVSMDPHAGDISLGLYREDSPEGPGYLIHTYSANPEAARRVEFLTRAAEVLGGARGAPGQRFRFPCQTGHQTAARRLFLEAAKLPTGDELQPRPLTVHDRKSGQDLTVEPLGAGRYRVTTSTADEARCAVLANGLRKLAEMDATEGQPVVAFPCGQDHHELVGLLLPRALNVRAALREEESALSRGQLSAPSSQK